MTEPADTPAPDLAALDAILRRAGARGVALAYSGGVDSAFLKWRLAALGVRFAAYRAETPLLDVPQVAGNAPDRCYHCKREIFRRLAAFAAERGLATLMDGTNADDLKTTRPGLRALRECRVISPLALAGLTKPAIRAASRAAALPFADRPASPCLATRFPVGTRLTTDALARVARAEEAVRALLTPTCDLRLRVAGGDATLEVSVDAYPLALRREDEILRLVRSQGYGTVRIALSGRAGKTN